MLTSDQRELTFMTSRLVHFTLSGVRSAPGAGRKAMDPKHVNTLHDAIKKAIGDPACQKVLECLDQENYYLSTDEYARHVKIGCDEERANVERAGLTLKPWLAGGG